MADIFISYKREDRARIAALARVLEARGYTVWWDLDLVAGQRWRRKIKSELDAARCVIVVWTQMSVGADGLYSSEWVEKEADHGHARGALVPVLLDSDRVAWDHKHLQFANLVDWRDDDRHAGVADLLEGVKQYAGVRASPEAVELEAWTQAEQVETAKAFRDFLGAFPASRFAAVASGRAAELEEAAAWAALGSSPTIAALTEFLHKYPVGRFADDAGSRIRGLEQVSPFGHQRPDASPNLRSASQKFRLPAPRSWWLLPVALIMIGGLLWQLRRPTSTASAPAHIVEAESAPSARSEAREPPPQGAVPEPALPPPLPLRLSTLASWRGGGSLLYAPDFRRIYELDRFFRVRDLRGNLVEESETPFEGLFHSFSRDASLVYTGGNGKIYERRSGRVRHDLRSRVPSTWALQRGAFSPDGRRLVTSLRDENRSRPRDQLAVWDTATGHRLRTIPMESESAMSMAFSADGVLLAVGDDRATIRVLNVSTGEYVSTMRIRDGEEWVQDIDFVDGTNFLVSTSRRAIIWDFRSAEQVRTLGVAGFGAASTSAVSGDRTRVAVGYNGGKIAVFDFRTGALLAELERAHQQIVTDIAFSDDADRFVSIGGGGARLWEVVAADRGAP